MELNDCSLGIVSMAGLALWVMLFLTNEYAVMSIASFKLGLWRGQS